MALRIASISEAGLYHEIEFARVPLIAAGTGFVAS
jgi:hypothetical protein